MSNNDTLRHKKRNFYRYPAYMKSPMKRIVLGTAGHIDHGKTTLIKALTGVDCDRLKEEKERGITIELGFTSLTLPGGQTVSIVDVPGHERFIKNMVAGAGGIDAVMLIIAADEGIMPQTREHLDICRLLAVRQGIIVMTKTDMVDAEWLSLVTEDIKQFVRGSFLEKAPLLPVSSATGAGLPGLLSAIERLVDTINERPAAGMFRLPVDRVFSMKGFGTVVTGTLMAGSVAVGDDVEILPRPVKAKIRGIQVHNTMVETATAGLRTALNLQGIERDTVERGNVLVRPGTLMPTRKATAWFEHLQSAPRPLKNRAKVRFHSGTDEIAATVILLDADVLQPGQQAFVQLVFEASAVLLPHDRYVLRSFSPVFTVGGGEILDNRPPRHRRFSDDVRASLETLKGGNAQEALLLFCSEAGPAGLDFAGARARLGLEDHALHNMLEGMVSQGSVVAFNKTPIQITAPAVITALEKNILSELKSFHAQNPMKGGMVREELKTRLPKRTDPKLYSFAVALLEKKKKIALTREFLHLPDHRPSLQGDGEGLQQQILGLYKKGGITPPTAKELTEQLGIKDKEALGILNLLAREGSLIKLNDDIFYDTPALNELTAKITDHMKHTGELTIQSLKDLTGLSRKFMIPLFEYLDKAKITMRLGDKRVLRKQG